VTSPALSRAKRGGGRVYVWEGREYPSVTTILGATVPKPALVGWAARATAEWAVDHRAEWTDLSDRQAAVDLLKGAPFRDRDRAADVGSAVHHYAERIARGETVTDASEDVAPFIPHFARFLDEWEPEYVETEATVFNLTAGYAGTLDAIAVIRGKTYLLDTKTGRDVYPDVALQLAAYEAGEFIGRDDGHTVDDIPDIDAFAVLHLRPDGYRLVPIAVDFEARRAWKNLLAFYAYLRGAHERAVGPDMVPEAAA